MSFTRLLAASAVAAAILSATGASSKPITTTGETNLRQAAGTQSPVVTLIPRGTTVDVGTCSNGWCQVTWNGQNGYVIAQNLGMAARRAPPGPPPAADGEYPPDAYGPPPVYAAAPPPAPYYYGYGPYYGYPYYGYGPYYGGGWGYRGGWGRRW